MKTVMTNVVVPAVLAAVMVVPALAQTPPPGSVNARLNHQQSRIDQGIGSGQLTGRETGRLERRENRIRRQVAGERLANGGKLTAREHRHVERELNRTSRSIYRKKHNAAAY